MNQPRRSIIMTMRLMKKTWMALVLVGAVGVAACSDDPTGLDDHADDVEGIALVLSGAVIATFDGDTRTWTGQLTVAAGQETAHIDVRLLDHDGDPVTLSNEYYLDVVIANEAVAEWEQDTPGEFGGHLHGVAAGQTTAVFRLMHGAVGSGHADFETTAVVVRVN